MSEQNRVAAGAATARDLIYAARMASNEAIARRHLEGVSRYWVDDMVVISGEGGKYMGKKNLLEVWKEMFAADMPLFERIPDEISVGAGGQLAWEYGLWRYTDGAEGGRYAAMWCLRAGVWMTRSELFVSLD